ncbi:hypothetical protein DFR30_2252 [Thiogranum longum]|uniref:ABC-type transport auxiliary lipoprotein component domain-containing protein n=1 Tax=Thiogranum longum TaxID=1537524 RepID=A0A4R1HE92_9GAMM|nr:PqiC family protein [Thiogranum longum]TCK18963.1 hypothetical protein DFR30_2252 [Thiogranum longum]
MITVTGYMRRGLSMLMAAGLSACTLGGKTPESEFYVLTAGPAGLIDKGLSESVSLGPVTLPDVVLRPQIATRPAPGRMVFAEFHRWAGDLRANVERVLLQGLSQRLGKNAVHLADGGDINAAYRLAVHFQRFDGTPGKYAVLQGHWRVKSGCLVDVQNFTIEMALGGGDHAALVEGLDAGLDELADQIAHALVKYPVCHNTSG